ncbi:hypothetical protein IME_EC2_51 [Enterobacteria phage IME_EC2]|uniref:Uncharacterized protein n=1 Tax=Enterobacteria phage IME_EC2 TaxID=1414766 RepID=A0A0A0P1R8_9CAUD|nr:hypothetical protein HOQ93_gp51 [Enterobacteria phage IME_EC2]AGZ17842.1 hypothetical protein IME_EC2_51 [Enterobacteria phage IME_EC2]
MVFDYCKRCHLPIPSGREGGMCDDCAKEAAENAVAEMVEKHLADLRDRYGEPPVFCLLVDPKGTQTGRQLRDFRDRNRLYCRAAGSGLMFRVPGGWGSSQMVRSMRNRRLYLLTNGMY